MGFSLSYIPGISRESTCCAKRHIHSSKLVNFLDKISGHAQVEGLCQEILSDIKIERM